MDDGQDERMAAGERPQESWGPFGRGWSNERFSAEMIAPRPFKLIAYPKAWTPGLGNGTGDGGRGADARFSRRKILRKAQTEFKGQLKGKFVLTAQAGRHYAALRSGRASLHGCGTGRYVRRSDSRRRATRGPDSRGSARLRDAAKQSSEISD